MATCLGKSWSFGLPRVPFVNCCQFMYLVVSLLVLTSVFVVRCLDSIMPILAKSTIARHLLDSVAEQAGLSLT